MMTDTDTEPQIDTYGMGEDEQRASSSCYTCHGSGFREVLRRGHGTVHPCPACRPFTYARWLAGHLCCRVASCPTCGDLASQHADDRGSDRYRDTPTGGGAGWLD